MANKRDSIHIRGVLIDKVVLSMAGTDALTSGYGEFSGSSSNGISSWSGPCLLRRLPCDDSALCSGIIPAPAKDTLESIPWATSPVSETDRLRLYCTGEAPRRVLAKRPMSPGRSCADCTLRALCVLLYPIPRPT